LTILCVSTYSVANLTRDQSVKTTVKSSFIATNTRDRQHEENGWEREGHHDEKKGTNHKESKENRETLTCILSLIQFKKRLNKTCKIITLKKEKITYRHK